MYIYIYLCIVDIMKNFKIMRNVHELRISKKKKN